VMRWGGASAAVAKRRAFGGGPLHELRDAAVRYWWLEVDCADGILGLPAEAEEFWAVGIFHAGVEHVMRHAEIRPGAFETWIDLPVRRAARLGRIVLYFDRTDAPSPEAFYVCVESARTGAYISDCSETDGRPGQALPGLPVGRYVLEVRPDSIEGCHFLPVRRTIDLQPGDNIVSVLPVLGGTLSCRVVVQEHADREKIGESLRVRVVSLSTLVAVKAIDRFDYFDHVRTYVPSLVRDVDVLPRGRYRVEAIADGVAPVTRTVTIEARKHVAITLRLR